MTAFSDFARTFGSYLWGRGLQHLIVHVTNHCNFRCEHCFIDFSPKRDLSLEAFRTLARDAGRLFWLDVAGGEPFLRKDLAEIVAAFDAEVVQIPTNGSLPDLVVSRLQEIQRLSPCRLTLSLSLDGLEETHGKVRGQPESWNQVWETFARVRRLGGVEVKINTVVTRTNVSELIPLMRLVRERGPDFHSIVLLRGEPLQSHVELPPLDELRARAPEMFAILGTYDYGQGRVAAHVLRNYHRYLWKVSLRTIEEARQVVPCQAGKFHRVVMGDGSVSSCEMLPPVANLSQTPWNEIMASEAWRAQVRSIERGECHCTHNCAMLGSILFNPAHAIRLVHQPS